MSSNFVLILTLTRDGSPPAMMQLYFDRDDLQKAAMERITDNWATNPDAPMMITDSVGLHTFRPIDILATTLTSKTAMMMQQGVQPANGGFIL